MTARFMRGGPAANRRGVYLLPNLFTTGNLLSGFYAMIAVFNADYVFAAAAILVATVFDSLDGRVARLTKTTSKFGVEYDSLADLVSFGVAPGLLIYSWALTNYGRIGWVAAFLFVACGALRLARFNVQVGTVEGRYFVGLPIPAAAGLIAATVLLDDHILRLGAAMKPLLIVVMTYVLAFLMVSNIRYWSFKGVEMHARRPFQVLVAAVLVVMVVTAAPQVMLFALFAAYAASGVVLGPLRAARRKLVPAAGGGAAVVDALDDDLTDREVRSRS
ncbi:MAG: CDP-diacylglycerol--serine O-phosphatidyltransferase [Nitrospirae bacterium RIFCSPHIGHO2_01_FULL_66_17]|nr:MAG: CDP-diacylglycerol--serine O-phosphatidyltransferase [Nitrospirae bacterium RIFCSPHIGHO2_01_FULL_66_17]